MGTNGWKGTDEPLVDQDSGGSSNIVVDWEAGVEKKCQLRLSAQHLVLSMDHRAEVLTMDHRAEVLSMDHRAEVLSMDHRAEVLTMDHRAKVMAMDHRAKVLTMDHRAEALAAGPRCLRESDWQHWTVPGVMLDTRLNTIHQTWS